MGTLDFVYLIYFKYFVKKYKELIYIYINLNKIVEIVFTFIIFYIFYKFNIKLLSENFILYYKYYISIMFIIFGLKMLQEIIWGLKEIYDKDEKKKNWKAGTNKLFKLITFLFNINILFWLFNLEFPSYLQYNILFVLESIFLLGLLVYDKLYRIKIRGRRLENFIYYPYIFILILVFFIKYTKKAKYDFMLKLTDYILVLDIEHPEVLTNKEDLSYWEEYDYEKSKYVELSGKLYIRYKDELGIFLENGMYKEKIFYLLLKQKYNFFITLKFPVVIGIDDLRKEEVFRGFLSNQIRNVIKIKEKEFRYYWVRESGKSNIVHYHILVKYNGDNVNLSVLKNKWLNKFIVMLEDENELKKNIKGQKNYLCDIRLIKKKEDLGNIFMYMSKEFEKTKKENYKLSYYGFNLSLRNEIKKKLVN